MAGANILVYIDRKPKTLVVGSDGPELESWGESPERYTLQFALDEERCATEGVWDAERCMDAIREAGFFARKADGSYGVLNDRKIAMSYLPGVRAPLPQDKGEIVRFPVGEENTWLHCWRSAPASLKPVLVLFHGNGETAADWTSMSGELADLGVDLFLVEYRGYGASEGGSPRMADMLDDIYPIFDAVGVDASQMIVYGRSVGSIFATEFVDRFPETRGLILESGVHDVYERLALRVSAEELGISEEAYRDAVDSAMNIGSKLRRYEGPLLVLHTEADDLVHVEHAHGNLAMAGSHDKMGVFFEKGGHNSLLAENHAQVFEELESFFTRTNGEPQECFVSGFLGHAEDPFYTGERDEGEKPRLRRMRRKK